MHLMQSEKWIEALGIANQIRSLSEGWTAFLELKQLNLFKLNAI